MLSRYTDDIVFIFIWKSDCVNEQLTQLNHTSKIINLASTQSHIPGDV